MAEAKLSRRIELVAAGMTDEPNWSMACSKRSCKNTGIRFNPSVCLSFHM
jgi:hypothetical protein